LDEAEMVESFVVLNAMGRDCFDDFLRLREDQGLAEMLGHGIPSPDAARLRLAVLTYNLLTALKRLALPAELLTARSKRLRFLIFNTPGRLAHHALDPVAAGNHGRASGDVAGGVQPAAAASVKRLRLAYRRIFGA
jgi:hypothetical protein